MAIYANTIFLTHPKPLLTGRVWIGGLLGKAPEVNGRSVDGAPQMIQLSLDGKRLFVTTSLFSTWDNQFYPNMKDNGGMMLIVDCDAENGGMQIREDFQIDFGKEPNGPARALRKRATQGVIVHRTSGYDRESVAPSRTGSLGR